MYLAIATIRYEDAQRWIDTVMADATQDQGDPVAVAVVGYGGELIAFGAMDGVMPAARQTAIDKAYTAFMFGRDTKQLEERVNQDPCYRQKIQTDPRYVFWAGAVTIQYEVGVAGALGVSGRKSEKDHELANGAIRGVSPAGDQVK